MLKSIYLIRQMKPALVLFLFSLLIHLYKFPQLATFDADQDFYGKQFLQIAIDHKPTLLGIEASVGGLYVGPLYTYISTIVYAISFGNPIGIFLFSLIIASLQAPLTYLFFLKLKDRKTAIFAALFVTFSYPLLIKAYAPSVIGLTYLAGLIFFYYLSTLSEKPKNIIVLSLICGLALHLHVSLFAFIPIAALHLVTKRPKNLRLSDIAISILIIAVLASPLFLFEIRHSFFLTKHLVEFFQKSQELANKNYLANLLDVTRSIKNVYAVFFTPPEAIGNLLVFLTLPYFILKLPKIRIFQTAAIIIIVSAFILSLYFGSFTDYYFYFLIAPFLFVFASLCTAIYDTKPIRYVFLIFLGLLFFTNLSLIQKFTNPYNYFIKSQAVRYIKNQVQNKKVKVYFDTELGLSVGFDYLLKYYRLNLADKDFEVVYQIIVKGSKKTPGVYFQAKGVENTIRVVKLSPQD